MAYRNLVAEPFATKAEGFKRMRDWLCRRNGSYDYSTTGLGWTLHDAVYAVDQDTISANDYFVIYSPGESGDMDLYFRFQIVSLATTFINVTMHQYWNATTHVGTNNMTTVTNLYMPVSTASTLYIYGDLDNIVILVLFSTSKYGINFGLVNDPFYDTTVATSSAAATAGANKVITVDAVPSSWGVGSKIVVRDNTNIQHAIISDITGSDVTVLSLATGFDAGFKLAHDYPVYCNAQANGYINNINVFLFSHNGTKMHQVAAVNFQWLDTTVAQTSYSDYDQLMLEYHAVPMLISGQILGTTHAGMLGYLKHVIGIARAAAFADLNTYASEDANWKYFMSITSSVYLLIKEV